MKERYVPIRPGIMEHLLRGDISAQEFGVYVIVHMQADFSTGIWRGSAPRVLNSAPRGAKLRDVQRALEHLAELGLLKHFHQHGQRGNFPFLINKFTVRSGALTGLRLNASRSESWQSPVYEPCAHDDADDSAHDDAQDAPIQEVRSKKEQDKKNPAEKIIPPSPDRFEEFWAIYPKKVARIAACKAWLKISGANGHFAEIILGVEKWKESGHWDDPQFIPNASTFLNGKRWQDEIPKRADQTRGREGYRRPSGAVPPEPGKKYPEPRRIPTG